MAQSTIGKKGQKKTPTAIKMSLATVSRVVSSERKQGRTGVGEGEKPPAKALPGECSGPHERQKEGTTRASKAPVPWCESQGQKKVVVGAGREIRKKKRDVNRKSLISSSR